MRNDWLILDAGPLIALVDEDSSQHHACKAALDRPRVRLITTEAVVGEACHLLRRYRPEGAQLCLQLLLDLEVEIAPLTPAAIPRLTELLAKYQDAPMDYADARLVVLAEQLRIRDIFTLDRRHLLTYRLFGRESFEVVP